MKDIIEFLLKSIVDFPDKITINEIKDENRTVLELSADPADVGKIIGKDGRVIKAIRTITKASTLKDGRRIVIEIIE